MLKKKTLRYIVINAIILIAIYFFYFKDIRICLIYNLFKIPCSGCGLTRSIIYFLKGDFLNSVRYNFLGMPLVILYLAFNIWYLIDLIKNKETLLHFSKNNKKKIIILCVIIFVCSTVRNIYNPLLY